MVGVPLRSLITQGSFDDFWNVCWEDSENNLWDGLRDVLCHGIICPMVLDDCANSLLHVFLFFCGLCCFGCLCECFHDYHYYYTMIIFIWMALSMSCWIIYGVFWMILLIYVFLFGMLVFLVDILWGCPMVSFTLDDYGFKWFSVFLICWKVSHIVPVTFPFITSVLEKQTHSVVWNTL